MESKKVDVLILGAGIVGLSLALELQKSSLKNVVVIDRSEAGFGCSFGNAGWITPCFAMPLPQPGMFFKAIGWLLDPNSPLYIKPEFNWLLAKWLLHFLKSMNQRQLRQSVAVLTDISKYSLNAYHELSMRSQASFGYDQKGLLMVSATDAGLRSAEVEMKLMGERGIPGQWLNQAEVLSLEPSLKPLVRGGVYFPTEAHAEPFETVRAVQKEFESLGGTVLSRTEAFDFVFDGNRVSEVITTRGRFQPDICVLALGTWSRVLASRLGVKVPVLGGKGYSLITNDFEIKPTHPIMIVEKKIAVTPRADSVRLAGTLELVDQDESITPHRVQAILRGSMDYMHMRQSPTIREVWRGLRPCTPDGVPMIGFSKKKTNLFYNLGHQMLGFQSAPGSARLAADLILGRNPLTDPKPFAPQRFE